MQILCLLIWEAVGFSSPAIFWMHRVGPHLEADEEVDEQRIRTVPILSVVGRVKSFEQLL